MIKIWNINNFECIRKLKGHTNIVKDIIKINKNLICSGSEDKSIILWNY